MVLLYMTSHFIFWVRVKREIQRSFDVRGRTLRGGKEKVPCKFQGLLVMLVLLLISEHFCLTLRSEKARLQAEAKAAEEAQRLAEAEAAAQAAAEAKRKRELEREAARQALLQASISLGIWLLVYP